MPWRESRDSWFWKQADFWRKRVVGVNFKFLWLLDWDQASFGLSPVGPLDTPKTFNWSEELDRIWDNQTSCRSREITKRIREGYSKYVHNLIHNFQANQSYALVGYIPSIPARERTQLRYELTPKCQFTVWFQLI